MHLLPDAVSAMPDSLSANFPMAYFFAALGFYILFVMQKVVAPMLSGSHGLPGHHGHAHDHNACTSSGGCCAVPPGLVAVCVRTLQTFRMMCMHNSLKLTLSSDGLPTAPAANILLHTACSCPSQCIPCHPDVWLVSSVCCVLMQAASDATLLPTTVNPAYSPGDAIAKPLSEGTSGDAVVECTNCGCDLDTSPETAQIAPVTSAAVASKAWQGMTWQMWLSPVMMWAGICVHGVLEGLSLGLQPDKAGAVTVLVAMVSHKWVESVALSSILVKNGGRVK